jgi:predicted Zn-dependent protease
MDWTARWRRAISHLERDEAAQAAELLEVLEPDAPSDMPGALFSLLAEAYVRSNQLHRARETVDRARAAGLFAVELEKVSSFVRSKT